MPVRSRQILLAPLAAALILLLCAAAPPAAQAAPPGRDLWLLAPSSADLRSDATVAGLRAAKAHGVNGVLVDRRVLSRRAARRLRANARAAGLRAVRVSGDRRACRAASLRCARRVHGAAAARRLIGAGRVAALRVARPGAVRRLRAAHGHGRVIAVLRIRRHAPRRWRAAIRAARGHRAVNLAVRPRGVHGRRQLARFLRVLSGSVAGTGGPAQGSDPSGAAPGGGSGTPSAPTGPMTPSGPSGGTGGTGSGPITGGGTPSTPAPPLPPASVFVATGGSDAGGCTAAAPCKTLQRAYQVADPGDVVEVAGGTYHDAGLRPDASKTSADDVVFRPAPGATVRLDAPQFEITASHVELRDVATTKWWVETPAQDVTMRGVDTDMFTIVSNPSGAPRGISVIGGDVGPQVDDYSTIGTNGNNFNPVPKDVLIDGVSFHDFTLSSGSSAHVECLQVWGGDGLTVRNSTFRNCHVFDILFNVESGVPTPTNIVVENNFLQCCGAGDNYSVRFSDTHGEQWKDVLFRNNSSNRAVNFGPGAPYTNVQVLANVAPRVDGTPAGVTFDNNVWYAGSKVGPHDQVAASGFVNAAAGDFHLVPGAAAIDHGGSSGPANDVDGEARPRGASYDAGADEAG
ncbi:MAG TPA: choice-of-anchor Q domain-containing protein [Baekduia sp.]|nr:choice-of-anchor Q domain-containing protein [Baekduia sp.]